VSSRLVPPQAEVWGLGRREVDVGGCIGGAVAAAAVARGDADGYAEGGSVDERLVQSGAGLGGPVVFAQAPADAQRGRSGSGVDGGGDSVEESAVGVFGAKYTTRVAFGARAPATSMSSRTSPSAPCGSLPAAIGRLGICPAPPGVATGQRPSGELQPCEELLA